MRNINKILVLFMLVMLVSFYGVWEFLQSEWVAKKISDVATGYAEEMLNADIEFESLKFKFFPPGADLKHFKIKGTKERIQFQAEINNLGIYFNPFDVLGTSFRVDEVRFDDGDLKIVTANNNHKKKSRDKKESKENKNILTQKSIQDYFQVLEDIPVNKVTFKDYVIHVDQNKLETSFLQIGNNQKHLKIQGGISNILVSDVFKEKVLLDEIQFKIIVNPQKIILEKVQLKKDLAELILKGSLNNYTLAEPDYKLTSELNIPLQMIGDFVDFSEVGQIYSGIGNISGKINGKGRDYSTSLSVQLKNIDSDFAYGESIEALLSINPERIQFEKMKLIHQEQQIELLKPFEFFNLKTKKWVEQPVVVQATKLKTDNFLKFLKDELSLIDGILTGEIKFVLGEDFYTFSTGKKVKIETLDLKPGGNRILTLKNLNLDYGNFTVNKGVFKMDLVASDDTTSFNLTGEIGQNKFLLKMPRSKIDLHKLSPITFFEIAGDGKIGFEISRNKDKNLTMLLDGSFNDLVFEGYRLDQLNSKLFFDFNSSTIEFKEFNGYSNKAHLSAAGSLNYKTLDINTSFKVNDLNFTELKRILKKHIGDTQYTSNEIHGNWGLEGRILGKMNSEEIKLDGKFRGENNYFMKESFDAFRFNYSLEGHLLSIKDFIARKATGKLYSFAQYNIKENTANMWLKLDDMPIIESSYYSKSPLNLQSEVSGSVNLDFGKDGWDGEGTLFFEKTSVLAEKYPDSTITLKVKDSLINCNLNGFGEQIKLESNIDLTSENSISNVKLDLNIPKVKTFFGIFKGVDILNTDLVGSINYSMNSDFKILTKEIINIYSNLRSFELEKKPIKVSYKNDKPEVVLKDKQIERWDVNVRGQKFYVLSKGNGNLGNTYDIITNMKIDASIIEIFNSVVSKANGNIRGKLVYRVDEKKKNFYEALLTSNNLSINTKFLPTTITKANMQISFANSVLKVDKFVAQLVSGFFDLRGRVSFKKIIPDINLQYKFKDAGLSVLKKSNLVFSGDGELVGKTFPYNLRGDFFIQNFTLVNELTDLGGDGAASIVSTEEIKYLPGAKKTEIENFLDLNLSVATREPIYIANSIADLGFVGNLQVTGGENDPKVSGKISLAPRKNRITFKNNEFTFSKGNVFFVERSSYRNPELDFLANSVIGDYKVDVKVLGPVKNFDMNLYSEPALPQSDILSLIAFGYTEDLSNSLSDQDKESMTRASLGSILFDSFKINETLKNEFGIQVNLGTAISQGERSYLSQRSSDAGSEDSRVRSATTFEIKKQLSDSMSLSVSSTVGTNTSQRQSLNLNYNVDKKVSLEGVYESRSTDETETINNDTSFGADLKVKWSFK